MYRIRFFTVSVISIFLFVFFAASSIAQEASYKGTTTCKMCHAKMKGKQYVKWSKMKHSKAYESLKTDEAKELAKKMNVEDPTTSEKCLKCHITTDKFTTEKQRSEGVGCERCHGPSSIHAKAAIKKDYKSDPKAEGRKVFKGATDEETKSNIEKLCRECHGLEHKDENPAAKEFKFDERWATIKHDEETLKKEFPELYK